MCRVVRQEPVSVLRVHTRSVGRCDQPPLLSPRPRYWKASAGTRAPLGIVPGVMDAEVVQELQCAERSDEIGAGASGSDAGRDPGTQLERGGEEAVAYTGALLLVTHLLEGVREQPSARDVLGLAVDELVEGLASATTAELRRGTDGTRWTNQQTFWHMAFGSLVASRLLRLVRPFVRLPDPLSRRLRGGAERRHAAVPSHQPARLCRWSAGVPRATAGRAARPHDRPAPPPARCRVRRGTRPADALVAVVGTRSFAAVRGSTRPAQVRPTSAADCSHNPSMTIWSRACLFSRPSGLKRLK